MSDKMPAEGEMAPEFCLLDSEEQKQCLDTYRGKWVVLYFYPRDNTPGCTLEAIDFTRLKEKFAKQNTIVMGVSKDSCKSHLNFKVKQQLTITLLADPEKEVLQKYGVWQLKKFMGRESMGTVRTTFLINPEGKISKRWEKVRAKGHAEAVLDVVNDLTKN